MSTASALLKREIRDGAFTTPSGDPIVAVRDTDEGNCGYCGDVVYGRVAETKAGMVIAAPGHAMVWRFNGSWLEPWHEGPRRSLLPSLRTDRTVACRMRAAPRHRILRHGSCRHEAVAPERHPPAGFS